MSFVVIVQLISHAQLFVMPWNFRCLGISCCLNWLADALACFHILYNICVTFMQEAIHKKYKLFKIESEKKTWRQVSTTLWRSFAIKGRSETGWWLGLGGWGKFSCFICKELSSERWSVSLRLTQLAWVSGEWLPGPGPQHSAPSTPTAAACFLWSLWGSLDTGLQGGPPTPMGIPGPRALELEGPALPLDLTDLLSHLSLIVTWNQLQTCVWLFSLVKGRPPTHMPASGGAACTVNLRPALPSLQ